MFSIHTRKRNILRSVLVAGMVLCLSCKTHRSVQTVHISVSGTRENPVELSVFNFLPDVEISRFVDRLDESYDYRFIPQLAVSIRDTSIRLFFSDSVFIEKNSDTTIYYSTNPDNIRYNRFLNELSYSLVDIRKQYPLGMEKDVLEDFSSIEKYLSEADSKIAECVLSICNKYGLSKKQTAEVLSSKVNTEKLSTSYFYLAYMPSLFDSITMDKYLRYYIPKVNAQKVSVFSFPDIAAILDQMLVRITGTYTWWLKSPKEFETYFDRIKEYFPKGSLSYEYAVSLLYLQASRERCGFKTPAMKQIARSAKHAAIRPYFEMPDNNLKDKTAGNVDKSFYTFDGDSFDFSELTARYLNKPLLIDFWASWCQPCIKKLPEIETYKKTYPSLKIISVSLDKSQDAWKSFLFNYKIDTAAQYRRNYNNQDSLFQKFETIPKYGFLSNGRIELYDDVSDSLITKYLQDLE